MPSRRAALMALCALILAVAAFAMTLRPYWPALAAGPTGPDAPNTIAAIPSTFNYQGTLRRGDGSLANGQYSITFRIYDQPTGGNTLHTETVSNVPVRDGVFNVVLGDSVAVAANVFADAPRYIGITVQGDGEMTPRQRLHPVPWAQQATQALNATNATNAQNATNATNAQNAAVAASISAGANLNNLGSVQVTGANGIATSYLTNTGDSILHGHVWLHAFEGNNQSGTAYLQARDSSGASSIALQFRTQNNGALVDALRIGPSGQILVNGALPVVIRRFKNMGNDADFSTNIAANNYECVATSWMTNQDWNERAALDTIVWAYVKNGVWWAKVVMPSHEGHDESADVDILCFRKEITDWVGVNGATRDLSIPERR